MKSAHHDDGGIIATTTKITKKHAGNESWIMRGQSLVRAEITA
jgi:hypothetical protein